MTSLARDKALASASRAMIVECLSAMSKFPGFHSAHEGYGVLLEELDELWDEVKKSPEKRDLMAMRNEAVQVGAMALRFLIDVCEWGQLEE